MSETKWTIRPAEQVDYAFILDYWAKSTRDEPSAGNIPNNMFQAVLVEAVRQLVIRGAKIVIACNPERHEQILGFMCYEKGRNEETVVHMIATKRTFRRMGIAKQLLAHAGLRPDDPFPFTYKTRMSRVFPNSKHLPGIQRRQKI